MTTALPLSELLTALCADLQLTCRVDVRFVPPCETRHNDARMVRKNASYIILINEYIKDDARRIDLVAHELRHVWQFETNFAMDLEDDGRFLSREAYEQAAEEVDARAYGAAIVAYYAGYCLQPWK